MSEFTQGHYLRLDVPPDTDPKTVNELLDELHSSPGIVLDFETLAWKRNDDGTTDYSLLPKKVSPMSASPFVYHSIKIDWSKPIEGANGYSGYPAEYISTDPASGRCPHEVRIQFTDHAETWMVDDCGISASMDANYRGIPLVQNVAQP